MLPRRDRTEGPFRMDVQFQIYNLAIERITIFLLAAGSMTTDTMSAGIASIITVTRAKSAILCATTVTAFTSKNN